MDAVKGFEADFDKTWNDAWTADTDGADHDTLDAIKAAYTPWKATLDSDVLGAAAKGDLTAAEAALHGKLTDLAGPLDTALQAAEQRKVDVAKENFDATESAASSATLVILVVTALALLISIGLGLALARSIVGRMKQVQTTLAGLTEQDATELQEGLDRINASDLTYEVDAVTPRIDNVGRDEIGQTAASANQMRDKLVAMIGAYNEARDRAVGARDRGQGRVGRRRPDGRRPADRGRPVERGDRPGRPDDRPDRGRRRRPGARRIRHLDRGRRARLGHQLGRWRRGRHQAAGSRPPRPRSAR